MAKTSKSSKPSGLKITRDGNKFICEWKIPSAKYGDGQQFKATTVSSGDISKTATKKTVTIDLSARYPASGGKKLKNFQFSVRGNSDKKKKDNKNWSDWASQDFALNAPRKPSITEELVETNKCKFSWSVEDTGGSTHYPFRRVVIQTKLVKNCTWAPKDDDWKNATEETSTSASSYKEYTENSATLASGNYTRLVRIKSQGCGGDSDWAYAKHVYAKPDQSVQTEGTVKDTSSGYDVEVNWNTSYDKSKPIDESIVEWVITTPNSDMSCPSGLTWTQGMTIKDTAGKEGAHISIDSTLQLDQCLYTRINTKHDSNITYGAAKLQKTGKLKLPTGLAVENVSQENQTAKITATNASAVNGTIIEIIYRKNGAETVVGTLDGNPNYKTVKCPAWTSADQVSFGVRAVLPKSTTSKTEDGVTIYTIKPYMTSDVVWQTGSVATAPSGLTLDMVDEDVRAIWQNNWQDANMLELSWSDNSNAWESTDKPQTFEIDNPFATQWRISGLEQGTTWYVKIRAAYDNGEKKTYSPYSNMAEINLSSSPNKTGISLSAGIIAIGESFTASWEYQSTDGTPQAEARIYEFLGGTSYSLLGKVSTQEHLDLPGWSTAGDHLLCLETISESGQSSGKSSLVAITVAPAVTCSMTNSLQDITITDDDSTTRTERSLTALPLTVTVTGAGTSGKSSVVIERAEAYRVDRPDETDLSGFKGETIFDETIPGAGTVTIGLDDLIGTLDDGAEYILRAIVTDNLGQTASVETHFFVHWAHQALMPEGAVIIDEEEMIAVITPIAPDDAISSDRCDIYRLSADKPVLVYKNAEFGSKYVDPYPAIGNNGGYRFVFMTANGDYNTAENVLAMLDAEDEYLRSKCTIIDFDGDRAVLRYDLEFSSSWEKDFVEKKFLGGSVKGYWKKGVSRKSDASALVIPEAEEDTVSAMRRLSEYEGECHVRTPDGSSFTADVQVKEAWDSNRGGKAASFTMKITRVDPKVDGMTYDEWIGGSV